MSRRLIKTSVLTAISVVLLYYNVAWAVLHCPHQQSHFDSEAVFYDSGAYAAKILSYGDHDRVNLDCTGPKFHTEMLAGPSTGSEFPWLTRDAASHVNVLLAWSGAQGPAQEIWRKVFVIRGSSPSFNLPQYLSLSVLRL